MTPQIWAATLISAVVAAIAPLPLRPVLEHLGVVDIPVARSSHTRPTLRGGGVAPLLGAIVFGAVVLRSFQGQSRALVAVVMAAAVVMGLVGLAEDTRGLSMRVRLVSQLLVGGLAASALWHRALDGWIWIALGAIFFAANVNFTNFMDGVNGISGLYGLVAGTAFAVLGATQDEWWLTTVGVLVAFTFAAFLPWNLIPPGLFLGDVGSYLLGALVAGMALGALRAGINPVAVLAPLSIYWADTVTTLVKKLHTHQSLFEAHRAHTYQRLTDVGIPHIGVASIVAAFAGLASLCGVLAVRTGGYLLSGAAIVVLCIAYLLLPSLLRSRAKAVNA